jgi:hypothetical protein
MVDRPSPRCHLSVAALASFCFLFLPRLVLVYIREQLVDPLVSVHPETRWVAVAEEAGDRNVVDFAGVVGEVVDEDKAFVEGDVVVGDDGDAADSKDYYLSLGGGIVIHRFPSAVLLLRGIRILDSSRGNIVKAKRETRGNQNLKLVQGAIDAVAGDVPSDDKIEDEETVGGLAGPAADPLYELAP